MLETNVFPTYAQHRHRIPLVADAHKLVGHPCLPLFHNVGLMLVGGCCEGRLGAQRDEAGDVQSAKAPAAVVHSSIQHKALG